MRGSLVVATVNHIPFNIILGIVPRDEVPLHYLQPDTVYLMIESKEADDSSSAELPLTNLLQYLATHVTVLVSETCFTHLNSLKSIPNMPDMSSTIYQMSDRGQSVQQSLKVFGNHCTSISLLSLYQGCQKGPAAATLRRLLGAPAAGY